MDSARIDFLTIDIDAFHNSAPFRIGSINPAYRWKLMSSFSYHDSSKRGAVSVNGKGYSTGAKCSRYCQQR